MKNWPLWIFIAVAICLTVLVTFPYFHPLTSASAIRWLAFFAVAAGIFAATLSISRAVRLYRTYRAGADSRINFVVTPIEQQCTWAASKQPDGTFVTSIGALFLVNNRLPEPLFLVTARLIRPKPWGDELPGLLIMRSLDSNMCGSAHVSGNFIPSGHTLPVAATLLIRGYPKQRLGKMKAVIELRDANNHKERVLLLLTCVIPRTN